MAFSKTISFNKIVIALIEDFMEEKKIKSFSSAVNQIVIERERFYKISMNMQDKIH